MISATWLISMYRVYGWCCIAWCSGLWEWLCYWKCYMISYEGLCGVDNNESLCGAIHNKSLCSLCGTVIVNAYDYGLTCVHAYICNVPSRWWENPIKDDASTVMSIFHRCRCPLGDKKSTNGDAALVRENSTRMRRGMPPSKGESLWRQQWWRVNQTTGRTLWQVLGKGLVELFTSLPSNYNPTDYGWCKVLPFWIVCPFDWVSWIVKVFRKQYCWIGPTCMHIVA